MVRMMNASVSLESMGGADLLSATRKLVRKSHGVEAELLMHLGEIDERKLYLACAHPSMFAFCVGELGFSEDAAYNRITVARAGRRLPAVIEAARSGRVHLAGLRLLAPHLNDDNHEAVLAQAAGKSKREIEELVARLAPLPPVPVVIRKLPECPVVKWAPMPARAAEAAEPAAAGAPGETFAAGGPGELVSAGAPREQAPLVDELPLGVPQPVVTNYRAVVAPLSGETFKVQFTASRSLRDKLRQAQDLLRHRVPDGDVPTIIERALELLIEEVKKERFGVGRRPRPAASVATGKTEQIGDAGPGTSCPEPAQPSASRHIPDAIKRAVYERDGGRCTFVDERGRRCGATEALEFDHIEGFARTRKHDIDGIRLVCRAHNQHLAEKLYGRAFMERARGARDLASTRPGTSSTRDQEPVKGSGTAAGSCREERVEGGSQATRAEDDRGTHLAELGCALHRAGEAELESTPDAHSEEGARIEREAARGLARVEGAVGREGEDEGVRFLVPVVAGLGRGFPAQGP